MKGLDRFSRFLMFIGIMFGGMWFNYDVTKNDGLNVLLDVVFLGFWFYQLVIKDRR